jgi:hypothetical protein
MSAPSRVADRGYTQVENTSRGLTSQCVSGHRRVATETPAYEAACQNCKYPHNNVSCVTRTSMSVTAVLGISTSFPHSLSVHRRPASSVGRLTSYIGPQHSVQHPWQPAFLSPVVYGHSMASATVQPMGHSRTYQVRSRRLHKTVNDMQTFARAGI